MQDGLRSGSLFQINIGVNKPRNLKEFLQRSAKNMVYEDDELATRAIDKLLPKKKLHPKKLDKRKNKVTIYVSLAVEDPIHRAYSP